MFLRKNSYNVKKSNKWERKRKIRNKIKEIRKQSLEENRKQDKGENNLYMIKKKNVINKKWN